MSSTPTSERALQLHGAAAITHMLDCIGACEVTDKQVSEILVNNEMEIRAVLSLALNQLADRL